MIHSIRAKLSRVISCCVCASLSAALQKHKAHVKSLDDDEDEIIMFAADAPNRQVRHAGRDVRALVACAGCCYTWSVLALIICIPTHGGLPCAVGIIALSVCDTHRHCRTRARRMQSA